MNKFTSITKPLSWLVALLLAAVMAGCGGGNSSVAPVTPVTLVSISVNPASTVVSMGSTQQFNATATYSNSTTALVTTTASWTSGTVGATVGLHTGLATGVTASVTPVVITAAFGGKTATSALTVTNASLVSIAVTPATASIPVYGTQQFVATATYSDSTTALVTTTASWTADTSGNATVGPNTGMVAGVTTSVTPVVITATLGGQTATAAVTVTGQGLTSIAVTPASAVIAVGGTQQFVATGTFANPGPSTTSPVTTTANWTADASGNATVGLNTGLATGVAASGVPVTITATVGGKTATAALTVAVPPVNPAAPVLGEAGRFVILAYAGVTTTGTTAISNGDIGITPTARSGMAGFTPTGPAGDFVELTGSTWPGMLSTSYAPNDANPAPFPYPLKYASPHAVWSGSGPMLTQAGSDETIAYNFLAADPNLPVGAPTQPCPTELGGLTLTRGVYKTASNVGITSGTLYLDAQGDPNAVWIFNISGTLTTVGAAPNGNIVFVGGVGSAKNVYWRVGGATSIAANSTFIGNIFDQVTIAVLSGANVTGSLFSATGSVTLIADTITKP